jgi:hypothetical protein
MKRSIRKNSRRKKSLCKKISRKNNSRRKISQSGGKIKLKILPHQKTPIQHIVSKCINQKGLLVNHYQGTGKTMTGCFFMKNFKENKVVLLPKALKDEWKRSTDYMNLNVEFLFFEDIDLYDDDITEYIEKFQNTIKNSILIVDEAHNLIRLIDDYYENLGGENFTEGDRPKTKEEKSRIMERKKKAQNEKDLFVQFIDILKTPKKIMLLTGTPIISSIGDIRYLINISAGKTVVPWIQEDFLELYTEKTVTKQISDMFYIITKYIGMDMPRNILEDEDGYYFLKSAINDYLDKIFITIDNIGSPINAIRYFLVKKIAKSVHKEARKFKLLQFKRSDSTIGKYVSFYKYDNFSEYYPSFEKKLFTVAYDDYQLGLLERYISNRLTDNEAVEMGLNKDLVDASFFKINYDYMSPKARLSFGRVIANMGEDPPKFTTILNQYISQNYKKTVVYSNFYESGILKFAKFLDKKNFKFFLYHPDLEQDVKLKVMKDFESTETGLMLIHPDYFEGFSVKKVRFLHILEPIMEFYKIEQLQTRVIRYNSHIELPKKDRNVTIIQWSSRSLNLFKKMLIKYNLVNSFYNQGIDFIEHLLDIFVNPESQILDEISTKSSTFKEVSNFLKQTGIENNTGMQEKCCIFGNDYCEKSQIKCIEYSKDKKD